MIKATGKQAGKPPVLPAHVDPQEWKFQQLKTRIHQDLVDSLDLAGIHEAEESVLRHQVKRLAMDICAARREPLSGMDRERLVDELVAEVFGLGPLEPLMRDPDVSDILVNDPYTVFVERKGRLSITPVIFADEQHLTRVIQRIVARVGRRIDEVSPMVDARLEDGSRINAIVPPLALRGPKLSIRRFGVVPLQINDLLSFNSIRPEMVRFLAAAVKARVGMVISGGTGSGKTTLLNAVSSFIHPDERLVTIEDSAELILKHPNWVQLETRPENTEGNGKVTQRELVRNSLRMRPDRIIVGEVRGAEVWDMLQAMNTGHEGSLTTVHANSANDALARLEMMTAMTGFEIPLSVVRQYVATGIKLIVHASRLKGGPRRVMQITEIVGVRDGDYILKDIFRFEQVGIDKEGCAYGEFHSTGNRPTIMDRIQSAGIQLPESMFENQRISDLPSQVNELPDSSYSAESYGVSESTGAAQMVLNNPRPE